MKKRNSKAPFISDAVSSQLAKRFETADQYIDNIKPVCQRKRCFDEGLALSRCSDRAAHSFDYSDRHAFDTVVDFDAALYVGLPTFDERILSDCDLAIDIDEENSIVPSESLVSREILLLKATSTRQTSYSL
jgi:hypothetical protein